MPYYLSSASVNRRFNALLIDSQQGKRNDLDKSDLPAFIRERTEEEIKEIQHEQHHAEQIAKLENKPEKALTEQVDILIAAVGIAAKTKLMQLEK